MNRENGAFAFKKVKISTYWLVAYARVKDERIPGVRRENPVDLGYK